MIAHRWVKKIVVHCADYCQILSVASDKKLLIGWRASLQWTQINMNHLFIIIQ
jgi:hypothetical protein